MLPNSYPSSIHETKGVVCVTCVHGHIFAEPVTKTSLQERGVPPLVHLCVTAHGLTPLSVCQVFSQHCHRITQVPQLLSVQRCSLQATIQGALGSAPLMLIQTRMVGRPDYAQYEVWGNQILHATAFSIILSAPIGLLVIALLGPLWLKEVCPIKWLPDVPLHGNE